MKQLFPLLLTCLLLTQCNTVRVTGVAPGTKISKLYIVSNPNLHMAGMQPEVIKQVQELGITPVLVDSPPAGNVYHLTYTAHWSWDMAMYLKTFEATLYEGNTPRGRIDYVTNSSDLGKFGHTSEKIRPLLRELLTGQKTIIAKKKPTSPFGH